MRPGNAGSNTAQDHLAVLAMALLALPKPVRAGPILVRADTAGAAILQVPAPTDDGDDGGWVPALDPGGRARPGAWVAELSTLDLAGQGWPAGTRAVRRRGRPHPGARHKLGFTDHTGHRFQVFITNRPDPSPAALDARHHAPRPAPPAGPASNPTAALESGHCAHARAEDRIRCTKATGLRNLPFADVKDLR